MLRQPLALTPPHMVLPEKVMAPFAALSRSMHAYMALTRGTTVNRAYVFTLSPKRADPVPGPRPAPELGRYDQIITER